MAAVARGHGGDGASDPSPPFRPDQSGHRGGSSNPRRGGRAGRGGGRGGGRDGGRGQTRQANKNVDLRKAVDKSGPQSIEFEYGDQRTFVHVGPNRAWFANYVGELVRSLPLHYPSWYKLDEAIRHNFMNRLGEFFDLQTHMRSPHWTTIQAGINAYIAKVYSDNKGAMKKTYFTLQGGAPEVDEIRRNPPPNIEPSVWEDYIKFYMNEDNQRRAAVNKENRKKNKVYSRHGSKSLAAIRHDYFKSSKDKKYPSLIQSHYDTHCDKDGHWLQDEARANYEEMVRLRDLGSDTPDGVPYTEEQILAMVLKGKQRGHIAGRRRVVAGSRPHLPYTPPPTPEIAELKKNLAEAEQQMRKDEQERKKMKATLDQLTGFMSENPRWHEYLTQVGSQPVDGSGSGSDAGCSGSAGGGSGSGRDDDDGDEDGPDDDEGDLGM